jgi:hypothetical protein
MIPSSANDVQSKTQWAEHHFRNFQMELGKFTRSHPYSIVIESDPETQETLYRLAKDFVVPDGLRLMAGDIVQNLRSTLDYLACALVRANGENPTNQTCFPISEDVPTTPEDEKSFSRKVKGMRKDVVDLIRTIKPYRTGDYLLWRLHRLNNIDKHRLLLTCGAFVHNWSITQHIDVTNPPLHILERMARAYAADMNDETSRQVTFALKAGDVLIRDFPNAKRNENIKFFLEVAIDEPGICEREPLSEVLFTSVAKVRQTIKRFGGMY